MIAYCYLLFSDRIHLKIEMYLKNNWKHVHKYVVLNTLGPFQLILL